MKCKSPLDCNPKSQYINKYRFEKRLCYIAGLITAISLLFVSQDIFKSLYANYLQNNTIGIIRHLIFAVIIAFLVYGGLVYLLTRWGYYSRLEQHQLLGW